VVEALRTPTNEALRAPTNYFSKKNSLFTGMVVQNNKQNLNKLWLKFFEKDIILYQYHFFDKVIRYDIISNFWPRYTICPADNATAGSLGRRRAGQLRFGFVAVSAGHIVYMI
jgi:hypothetical protein